MKQLICDLCGRIAPGLKQKEWSSFRCSWRWEGNRGASLFVIDACAECAKCYEHVGSKDMAITILKGLKK